ncbi:MAG: tRNA (adenosine(37)-N6)-threonylcarbamoyltransferase complex transferase subunit TsaD [Planctomycetia bacterium]|jgi:N6-L-threonylcarbamoyladenine synthase|nr:tRNA (adenosine(37)-N6)-threonylcarbamoyltransferase complex transferase subunit TsaD [Planctomycetia bacterium]MCC7313988.1 tRNA (adenosine(37)-N6)-threonylcarbamoyltransferase complex transferase subunit TsaD [Planctomycetota bacterium]
MTTILGIETSCDETSVAVVDDGRRVRCNLTATQFDLHAKYGGVVPEIASRAHLEKLDPLIEEALAQAACTPDAIDAIAVTQMPGLIGSLLIGVTAAKTLAWAWDKPLVGVNHIHAHATSAAIELTEDPWPAVALVVSGGHTSLYHVRDYDDITLLGATIDDAAGEAFDKIASILKLGFPGGPIVDKRAAAGNPKSAKFPRTMLAADSLDFSFSGLKTAVLYRVHGPGKTTGGLEKLSDQQISDICAAFSAAVVDVLVEKTMRAVAKTGVRTVVVGGGVAANSMLRTRLSERCTKEGLALHLTPMRYCTDNGAMIAAQGYHLFAKGRRDELSLSAKASVGIS